MTYTVVDSICCQVDSGQLLVRDAVAVVHNELLDDVQGPFQL